MPDPWLARMSADELRRAIANWQATLERMNAQRYPAVVDWHKARIAVAQGELESRCEVCGFYVNAEGKHAYEFSECDELSADD